MIPEKAFQKLCKELSHYNLHEVSEASCVSHATLYNWLSDNRPTFPLVNNFIAVCETLGLEIEITIK